MKVYECGPRWSNPLKCTNMITKDGKEQMCGAVGPTVENCKIGDFVGNICAECARERHLYSSVKVVG